MVVVKARQLAYLVIDSPLPALTIYVCVIASVSVEHTTTFVNNYIVRKVI